MTEQEVEVKFQKYAELGKALDVLKTLSSNEIATFSDDVLSIYQLKYDQELEHLILNKTPY